MLDVFDRYIALLFAHQIKLDMCFDFSANNVSFSIGQCVTVWQNAQNCIDFQFSIHLSTILANTSTANTDGNFTVPDIVELSKKQLVDMWDKFGRDDFIANGFKVIVFYYFFLSIFASSLAYLSYINSINSDRNTAFQTHKNCYYYGHQSV